MNVRTVKVRTGRQTNPINVQIDLEMVQQFFMAKSGNVAHIWDGADTFCTMWSTGGLKVNRGYSVKSQLLGRRICQQCAANYRKKKVSLKENVGKEFWEAVDASEYSCEEISWVD